MPQRRQYRRPHQKYGTGTLINKDKNPAQRIVPNPQKRGRRKQIGNPRYDNDNNPSPFDKKIDCSHFLSGSSHQPQDYEYDDYSQYPEKLDDYDDHDGKIDMDMDSGYSQYPEKLDDYDYYDDYGEDWVINKTKLEENGPRLKNPRSK